MAVAESKNVNAIDENLKQSKTMGLMNMSDNTLSIVLLLIDAQTYHKSVPILCKRMNQLTKESKYLPKFFEYRTKCIKNFNLYSKPSHLSWQQFMEELESFGMKCDKPHAGWWNYKMVYNGNTIEYGDGGYCTNTPNQFIDALYGLVFGAQDSDTDSDTDSDSHDDTNTDKETDKDNDNYKDKKKFTIEHHHEPGLTLIHMKRKESETTNNGNDNDDDDDTKDDTDNIVCCVSKGWLPDLFGQPKNADDHAKDIFELSLMTLVYHIVEGFGDLLVECETRSNFWKCWMDDDLDLIKFRKIIDEYLPYFNKHYCLKITQIAEDNEEKIDFNILDNDYEYKFEKKNSSYNQNRKANIDKLIEKIENDAKKISAQS